MMSAGTGAVMIPVMSVADVGLPHDQVPRASIITRLTQQVGGAFGTAILAVILAVSLVLPPLESATHPAPAAQPEPEAAGEVG